MQLALLALCADDEHLAAQRVGRFNWDFGKVHQGGLRITEQQEEVLEVLEDMSMDLDFGYREVSQKYADRINALFQRLRDSIADFGRTLSAKTVCEEEYERPEPLYGDDLTFEILNMREYQTNESDDLVYQAGVDNFLYEAWEGLKKLNFS